MVSTRGEETRRRIVEAAWELSSGRGVEAILGGVTLRELAASLGLSPSAITYHFPTMHDLALAMVEHHCGSISPLPYSAVESLLASARAEGLAAAVRQAAAVNWALVTTSEETEYERRLTRCYSVTGASRGGERIAGLVAGLQASWVREFADIYRHAADDLGLQPVAPLTVHDLALAISALSQGLLDHWLCDPGSVRPELFSDVAVALASAVLVSRDRSVALAEVSVSLPVRSTGSASAGHAGGLRAAAEVAPLFRSGVESVTLTELGTALGCEADEVAARYGSVRRLAAMSFSRHLELVGAAASRRPDAPAAVRLADAVHELARAAQQDPHCATALLVERVESRNQEPPRADTPDIHLLVPAADAFVVPLSGLLDAPESQRRDLAELLVDTVLGYSAGHPRTALSSIVGMALRLVDLSDT